MADADNYTSHDTPTDALSDTPDSSPGPPHKASRRAIEGKSERDKRTYRACLHCRQRKSRCDLYSSGEPGRPPCERCIREQHECVLGSSRRGGRRVKRVNATTSEPRDAAVPDWNNLNHTARSQPLTIHNIRRQNNTPPHPQMHVDESVAETDLQNTADALEFLAHVAEQDSSQQIPASYPAVPLERSPWDVSVNIRQHGDITRLASGHPPGAIDYAPLNRGYLSLNMIHSLLRRYQEKYHPFFPIANPSAMDPTHLAEISSKEPHLLAALLTVASKDEKEWSQLHETCSAHMQHLIADLVYTGCGTVEAVEAMLILAEWVPRRSPSKSHADVGRGEEDQAAWMYVGIAIRLGYLLGIDRAGFRSDGEAPSADLNRRRLAWAAVYMSDRQISIRIGKAFWSRGPGPLTGLRSEDFPSLQQRHGNGDDFASIFQAHLELTQLFSNAHDVLYATKSRSNQLNFGGEYVKYIDDFRTALRSWHSTWGMFSTSGPLKASLILSYEYLRLYVNAFAYQATLNRLVAQVREDSVNGRPTMTAAHPFADVAATPDARFIYDSIDAAKSLLSTFNSFVDPVETFRFMPLRYYLYVIYCACFLYKARSTGVMGGDSRGSVKRMILDTIDKLQKSSACDHDIGDRYSRLIKLLWRKPPGRAFGVESIDITRPATAQDHPQALQPSGEEGTSGVEPGQVPMYEHAMPPSIGTFSWLDLPAVGEFVTQNNSITGSMDGLDRFDGFDDSSMDGFGLDQNMMNMLPPVMQWDTLSPSGVIF